MLLYPKIGYVQNVDFVALIRMQGQGYPLLALFFRPSQLSNASLLVIRSLLLLVHGIPEGR